jgi:cell wall-associated NlpC family hydrolase
VRRLLAPAALLVLTFTSAAMAKPSAPSWAKADIDLVVSRGLLPRSAASRPEEPLTHAELAPLVAGISRRPAPALLDPYGTVTVAQLDAKLVGAVGLSRAASAFLQSARAAGLKTPSRFGTEAVARLLALRTNHPAPLDALELRYDDPATRAEAAYSAARILKFKGWEVKSVETSAAGFALPTLDPWQKRVLSTGVSLIGLPYIWGGTSERPQAPLGVAVRGGFDCSGFVSRVFKQTYPGGAMLPTLLGGRTAAAMAGAVPRAKRIGFNRIAPADLLFFGSAGPRSKPQQVDHVGVALGNGWMIHSSRHGVAVVQLNGWYRERFAWARRPLAEAGLTTPGV